LCYFPGTHRIFHPELSGGIATSHSEAATQRWLSLCINFKILLQSILGLHSGDKVSINQSLSPFHLRVPPVFSDHLAMSGLTHCHLPFCQGKFLSKGPLLTPYLRGALIYLSCTQVYSCPAWGLFPYVSQAAEICVLFHANLTNCLISEQAFNFHISFKNICCLLCSINIFQVQLRLLTT